MNHFLSLPFAWLNLSPAVQVLGLFFVVWTLVMFLVLHIDGHRAR